MREPDPLGPAPLLDSDRLDRFLEAVRARGERLVFTNGCFDLIHPGHVAALFEARALGDRLLVGLNSDESVRRLKGNGRPLIGQHDRALLLGSLRCVDAVALFGEDTPRELIRRVRPDVLVKGGDYRPEEIAGARDLPEWGGRLAIVPFRPGHSTSDLIRRISPKPDHCENRHHRQRLDEGPKGGVNFGHLRDHHDDCRGQEQLDHIVAHWILLILL